MCLLVLLCPCCLCFVAVDALYCLLWWWGLSGVVYLVCVIVHVSELILLVLLSCRYQSEYLLLLYCLCWKLVLLCSVTV